MQRSEGHLQEGKEDQGEQKVTRVLVCQGLWWNLKKGSRRGLNMKMPPPSSQTTLGHPAQGQVCWHPVAQKAHQLDTG